MATLTNLYRYADDMSRQYPDLANQIRVSFESILEQFDTCIEWNNGLSEDDIIDCHKAIAEIVRQYLKDTTPFTKSEELKLTILNNFIDYLFHDENERREHYAIAVDYIREDHVNELAEIFGETED